MFEGAGNQILFIQIFCMQVYIGWLACRSCYYEGKFPSLLAFCCQKFILVSFFSSCLICKSKFITLCLFQDFPSQIVHIAVNCVDQYLMRRKVQRSELQLLGITCMLIAARLVISSCNAFFELNIYKSNHFAKHFIPTGFKAKTLWR